ncbi:MULTISPECIES: acyl-CoA thioesterase [Vibrio]|jgi:acyl-CoA thioester hydrolase|uniref:Thioesterase n=1 Tax=Vibrio mediterranei TaxID=689 RepID=A0AAJ3QPJ4_9VIBR|nr:MULTISPECIES: thioesterase family protein [Vibrio]ASI93060.1 thioesterase [Vibrio mediterranei]KFA98255.1 thioesterase [Vibrio sp. ER1A]MCF4176580.1 acyl-CoA thioesterase [Vibrio sp. McD22-P3]MCG9656734.1 acyl-CoA thioesterase [Vibrio mediterranei]MCG9663124.1 acyl-CoA thioesterase [Vibrio mediterranei]
MESLLKDYSVVTEIPVAWGEMDALNHVNNAVYFRYFETARLDYFSHINLMEDMAVTNIGPVLGETYCRYKLPVTYPDTLLVGSRITEVQEDRFKMEYQVVSKKLGKVTTTGTATIVMFDFTTNQKALISDKLMSAIEQANRD